MSYLAEVRRSIVPCTEGHRAAVLDFRARAYGTDLREGTPAYFDWLFGRNPARRHAGLELWIACRGGNIVGQQGGIPFRLSAAGRDWQASWAVDLLVEPEWQRRGIGPALTEAHRRSCEVACALGVSDAAWHAYVRAGWLDLGRLHHYVRPLDLRRFLLARPLRGRVADAVLRRLGAAFDAADRLRRAITRRAIRDGALTFATVARFDADAEGLCSRLVRAGAVMPQRDPAWLAWRFDQGPQRDAYTRVYMRRKDALVGYAVYRINQRHRQPIGVFVDVAAVPGSVAPLVADCLQRMQAAGAVGAYCTCLDPDLEPCLTRLGFWRDDRPWEAHRLLAKANVDVPELRTALADAARWRIRLADSDIDTGRLP